MDRERLEALRNANNGSLKSDEKHEVIAYITADKAEIQENISELEEQQQVKLEYALNFMHDVQCLWLDADPDLKIRFQKIISPEGLTFDTATITFGTSTIGPLYRYAPKKTQ